MKQVMMYRTTDGKLFEDHDDAVRHEVALDIKILLCRVLSQEDADEVMTLMKNNSVNFVDWLV